MSFLDSFVGVINSTEKKWIYLPQVFSMQKDSKFTFKKFFHFKVHIIEYISFKDIFILQFII
ncbi:MAG: hypothetical protein AYK18_01250 [Theionarchaea archaeon DG-70]|nr:MAG: hypothetical protein AYK18_01250 [Theionarchaea archaeon DG-70]